MTGLSDLSHCLTLNSYVATMGGPSLSPSSKDKIRLGTIQKIPVHANKARHNNCTRVAPDDVNGTIVAHDDANVINESGLEFPLNTSNNVLSEISHQNNVLSGICNKDNSVSRQDHLVDVARETNYPTHRGNMYGMVSEQGNFLNGKEARHINENMTENSSSIFTGHRPLGYVSNHIPLVTRYYFLWMVLRIAACC